MCVPTKFANAGQVCVTADRFYVHEKLRDAFVKGFAERAKALKLGHGLKSRRQMGPLINQRRVDAMEAIVADAKNAAARSKPAAAGPLARTRASFSSRRSFRACRMTPRRWPKRISARSRRSAV